MNIDRLKPYTILYIEDEPLIRQNALEYISRYCKKVYEASDGMEGWQRYCEYQPDIIISDIQMPKLNGLDMVNKIRKDDKKTPIILVTAHTNTEYLIRAVELQLIKYVVKPITEEKLQEALNIACDILSEETQYIVHIDKNIIYDTLNQTLIQNNTPIKLTHNELLFIDLLIKNRERIVTYEEIESLIWKYEGMSIDALRTLVRSLRKKLQIDVIKNYSGVGYRLQIFE
jgi:DNA-binding response OmpR family regulator